MKTGFALELSLQWQDYGRFSQSQIAMSSQKITWLPAVLFVVTSKAILLKLPKCKIGQKYKRKKKIIKRSRSLYRITIASYLPLFMCMLGP